MRLTDAWLRTPPLQAVMAALSAGGAQVLIVGGAVRNAVMGLPAGDIDLATDALPATVQRLAGGAGLKVVPTGLAHGTLTVIAQGRAFEVTSFRRDIVTHGRHATVAFGGTLEEDAGRRDFTMNALYARADGTILDPLGGLTDARAGRVRFIRDARTRIREDSLRILRFFRLNAWYGRGPLDPAGLAACAELAASLDTLSRERVGAEVLKLLAAPAPLAATGALAASGGLARILPGAGTDVLARLLALEPLAPPLPAPGDHPAPPNLGNAMPEKARSAAADDSCGAAAGVGPQDTPAPDIASAAGAPPDPLRRLAALGGEEVAQRLRLSRAQARALALLQKLPAGSMGPAEAAWRHGAAVARDVALLRAARQGEALPPDLGAALAQGAAVRFPLRARDLPPHLEGPALGRALARLERLWIDSGFTLGPEALLGTLA